MANLLILHAGRTIGPYTAEEARSYLAGGHLSTDTPAWTEGLVDWSTTADVLELLDRSPPSQAKPEFTDVTDRVLIPDGVRGFSWAAALMTLIWCLAHRVWIGLLFFIPGVGQLVSLWLGFHGRELAWRQGQWRSVKDFQQAQRRWTVAALSVWGVLLAGFAMLVLAGRVQLGTPGAAANPARPAVAAPSEGERRQNLQLPARRQDFERYFKGATPEQVRAALGVAAYERADAGRGVLVRVYRKVTLQPNSQVRDDAALIVFVNGRADTFQFMQEKN